MGATSRAAGNFVILLDFELMWGVRDHATPESYGANVLGGRKAIPDMLEHFQRRGIRATWAIVGALLCENKDELLARAEHAARKGAVIARLDEIGPDEERDPYHFGASLARLIASCPVQEIGTHTFSHRCALEPGEALAGFSADLASALVQLRHWGIKCKSIVFPRNQYGIEQLATCRALRLTHFRGNEQKWFYAPAPGKEQTKARRLCRLVDSYIDLSGADVSYPDVGGDAALINLASSRFLRPFAKRAAPPDGLRLRRIERRCGRRPSPAVSFILGGIRKISAETSLRTWPFCPTCSTASTGCATSMECKTAQCTRSATAPRPSKRRTLLR
jgi:hypothetical protein